MPKDHSKIRSQARNNVTDDRLKQESIKLLEADLLRSDYETLLKMPEFKRVMKGIISNGGMFRTVMTGNSQTFHNAGRQDFCREIWAGLAAVNQQAAFDILRPNEGDELQ